VLVVVNEAVANGNIDAIVEFIQGAAVSVNTNTLMALTGNEGTSPSALLSLL